MARNQNAWNLRLGNLLKEWKAAWESTKDFIISFVHLYLDMYGLL